MADQAVAVTSDLTAASPRDDSGPALADAQHRPGHKRSLEDLSSDEDVVGSRSPNAAAIGTAPPQKRTKRQSDGEGERAPSPMAQEPQDSFTEQAAEAAPQPELEAVEDLSPDTVQEPTDEVVQQPAQDTPPQNLSTPAPAPLDWNSGIQNGIRTSFGKPTTTPSFLKARQRSLVITSGISFPGVSSEESRPGSSGQHIPDAAGNVEEMQPEAQEMMNLGAESGPSSSDAVVERAKPESGRKAKLAGRISLKGVAWKRPSISPNGMDGRKADYLKFCRRFCAENSSNDKFSLVDARLLRRAFNAFLDESSVPKTVRSQGRRSAKFAEPKEVAAIISEVSGSLLAAPSESQGTAPPQTQPDEEGSPTAGEMEPRPNGTGRVYLSREEELRQLRLYFPGAPETGFCVWCATTGHSANDCPPPTCRHCQRKDHPSAQCPTRVRCSKCRALGHSKADCQEKLRLAPGEAVECAICCATDHTEEFCESLWRTFEPDASPPVKVQAIPAFCYNCGSGEHFGGDCVRDGPRDDTWSVATRDRYIDPESDTLPLSWVPPPPPDQEVGRPNLGGRSIAPQTHIYFQSDDEEEGEFIQPPVRPRNAQPPRAQIRINAAAAATNGGGHSSLPRRPPAQARTPNNPPLPPGPPPPLPPSHDRQSGLGRQTGASGPSRGRGGGRRGRGGFSRARGGGGR